MSQNTVVKMEVGQEEWYVSVSSIINLKAYHEKPSSGRQIDEYPYKLEIRYSKDCCDRIGCSDKQERDKLMAVLLKYMGNVVDVDEETREMQQQAQADYDPMAALK